ncbi:unspecific monooxygenase, partial [Sarracenia purpurea var. burkii]
DVFGGGSETSSTVVEWTMSEMMKNPEIMKRVQYEVRQTFAENGNVHESGFQELKYLNSVIKETLRLHPSFPLLVPRESNDQCVINECEIPAKTKVFVNAWAIRQDPRYWNEPERFNPKRFMDNAIDFKGRDLEYIPFEAGRRICPGIFFVLPNIELPLAQLLYHFDWKLPNGMKEDELDMAESLGATVKRKHDLYLIPISYDPLLLTKV